MKKTKKLFRILFLLIILLGISGCAPLDFAKDSEKIPKATMILIEYENPIRTLGLSNFVNEMKKRNISGLLMVTPEYVKANCEDIKKMTEHNIELIACNVDAPFWDVPYEKQKSRITEMLENIEKCTGQRPRIISSRYFASDLNTVKIAQELDVPYVTARGTTGTKATVYALKDYDVKILSVSNIPLVTFKYGSLCDYSFFERAGTPKDMLGELNRAVLPLTQKEKQRFGENHMITPVSHTRIGGYLKPWMNMWTDFWDNTKINWVNLDELMAEPDWTLPSWQLPINKNAPYTPEKIRPLVPYEQEEKIQNPCAAPNIGN